MANYILSIDQGTSGTKALIFDEYGQYVQRHNETHRQIYPNPGWVEHDAVEIFENAVRAIDEVIKKAHIVPDEIKAVSIANQRETTVVWDRRTGLPIANAVVWQCNRAVQICEEIKKQGYADIIKDRTGLVLSPYYSAAKIKWLLDSISGAREKAQNGDLMCGTIDSWLIYKFTNHCIHATDYSNASRTQMFNLKELCWDREILEIFGIPGLMLPEIHSSDYIFGTMKVSCLSGRDVPITGVMGDSHAALFGQNCYEKGMTKVTYGTGSSIMMNIGKISSCSNTGLVISVGWGINSEVVYVAEGNINCSGASIKWLVDDIELIKDSKSTEAIAESISGNDGVYIVPAFVGLGTPYWDSEATAMITGMTRGTKKAHIVRAVLESMSYQVKDILDIMEAEFDTGLKEIRVDGGPTRNRFLMQFQSDVLNTKIVVNEIEEICAIGSAYMAGLAIGLWRDFDELRELRTCDTSFYPRMPQDLRNSYYTGWKKAVARTLFKP